MNKSIIAGLAIITFVLAVALVGSLLMRSVDSPKSVPVNTSVTTDIEEEVVVPASSNTNTSVEILNENVNTSVQIEE